MNPEGHREALGLSGAGYRQAVDQVAKLRRDLYLAIHKAHKDGMSLRQIATAAGLSHARVQQITA